MQPQVSSEHLLQAAHQAYCSPLTPRSLSQSSWALVSTPVRTQEALLTLWNLLCSLRSTSHLPSSQIHFLPHRGCSSLVPAPRCWGDSTDRNSEVSLPQPPFLCLSAPRTFHPRANGPCAGDYAYVRVTCVHLGLPVHTCVRACVPVCVYGCTRVCMMSCLHKYVCICVLHVHPCDMRV